MFSSQKSGRTLRRLSYQPSQEGEKEAPESLYFLIILRVEPRALSSRTAPPVYPWCRPVVHVRLVWYTQGVYWVVYTRWCTLPTILPGVHYPPYYPVYIPHHATRCTYPPCCPVYWPSMLPGVLAVHAARCTGRPCCPVCHFLLGMCHFLLGMCHFLLRFIPVLTWF